MTVSMSWPDTANKPASAEIVPDVPPISCPASSKNPVSATKAPGRAPALCPVRANAPTSREILSADVTSCPVRANAPVSATKFPGMMPVLTAGRVNTPASAVNLMGSPRLWPVRTNAPTSESIALTAPQNSGSVPQSKPWAPHSSPRLASSAAAHCRISLAPHVIAPPELRYRPVHERAASVQLPDVDARVRLDQAIAGEMGQVWIVAKAEASNHGSESKARIRCPSRSVTRDV